MQKINLEEKFNLFQDQWNPKIVAGLNDHFIKLVKIQGEFLWHHHDNEDELFFVVKGKMLMKFQEGDVEVNEGEMIIVPKGVEHKPVAEQETHIILLEPMATRHTGNVNNVRTRETLEWI
ncbi:MAG: cupin domain-containing protein [Bacteroidota bacterium]